MTTTTETQNFKINGVIDTSKTVWDNIETLASAAGSWVAFDIHTGKWSVIINRAGASIHSFNDSNVIGGINVTGTGLFDLYNSVSVSFPNKEIYDLKDVSTYEIPVGDRNPGEFTNTLNLNFDIVNDVIHAQMLALTELHQARVDKIIEFRTDYSKLALKAGDIIDVTNTALNYTAKKFRIISITEEDTDDNNIQLAITALEYSDTVYNYSALNRFVREPNNQLIQRKNNAEIQALDDQDLGSAMERMLIANAVTGLLNYAFSKNPVTKKITAAISPKDEKRDKLLSSTKTCLTITGPSAICEGQTLNITVSCSAEAACMFDFTGIDYTYEITGVDSSDTSFPLTDTYQLTSGTKTFSIPILANGDAPETLTFKTEGLTKVVTINKPKDEKYTAIATDAPSNTITEGGTVIVTQTTSGIADGTSIPYAITGSATGKVSSPALTGTVTVNSNQAQLTIVTTDDAVYTGAQALTVTFNPSFTDPCSSVVKSINVTVNDNDPAPKTCSYVSVPVVWCGTYDGSDDQLTGMTVRKSMMLPVAQAGEASVAVPTTVTVTKGNPSTIAITGTTNVATSANLGGIPINVITTFNSVAPLGLITGTTTTIYGYF